MLSLGIKNAILVLLIILILHVLIKNTLIEANARKPKDTFTETIFDKKQSMPFLLDPVANKVPPTKIPDCPAPEKKEDDNSELLKYVYGDDADSSDIGSYFKGITKEIESELNAKLTCPVLKSDDNILPLSTTCDPKLQNMAASLAKKDIEADCGLKQTLDTMLLTEYKDESSMNGGALFGNLNAFDDKAMYFQEYEAQCKI